MLLFSSICLKETTGSLEFSRKWAFSPLGNKDTFDITASHVQICVSETEYFVKSFINEKD